MRRFPLFVALSLLIGIALRLIFLRDIEYKSNEKVVFDAVTLFLQNPVKNWDWRGTPGASIWVFDWLGWISGARDPVRLACAVALLNSVALLLVAAFAWFRLKGEEQRIWLWGGALVAVDPLSVLLSRHIWAQSVLPFFAMATWIAWWDRRESAFSAFCYGALALLLGQIHLSGFFLAAGLALWTILFVDKRRFPWKPWLAGTALAALPLIPWVMQLAAFTHRSGTTFRWYRVFMLKFWNYWISNPTGMVMQYSLGKEFDDFLRWPLIGGVPTYAVLAAHAVLAAVVLGGTFAHRHSGKRIRKRKWKFFTDAGDPTGQLLNAALWGYGGLITASCIFIDRHYLLVVFPLVHVWVARFFHTSNRWLGSAWGAQLFVSLMFLLYVHAHGGVPGGDYGVAPFH